MHVEGVGGAHLPQGEAHDLPLRPQHAPLQAQALEGGKGADNGVVLVDHALVQALEVILGPHVQHVETAGDQLPRQGDKVPVVLGLEAVAVVFLAVEGFARVGGQLLRPIEVVQVVLLQAEFEAPGVLLLQHGSVPVGDAPDDQRVAPLGGKVPQGLDGRAQGAAADGEDEGRVSLVAQLRQHPVPQAGDELAVALVPDVDIAEIVVCAGAVLGTDDLVHPALVAEGHGFKGYHTS